MNEQEALTLVDYHYWARDRILDAVDLLTPEQYLKDLGNSFKSVRDTVVHTYGAEWVWYLRWVGTSPPSLPGSVGVSRRSEHSDSMDRPGREGQAVRPVAWRHRISSNGWSSTAR